LGGIVRKLGGTALEINGVEDHVHLLAAIPPTFSVSEFTGKVKSGSSNWEDADQRQVPVAAPFWRVHRERITGGSRQSVYSQSGRASSDNLF
jgi:REP element-mobilizing transposase RayT